MIKPNPMVAAIRLLDKGPIDLYTQWLIGICYRCPARHTGRVYYRCTQCALDLIDRTEVADLETLAQLVGEDDGDDDDNILDLDVQELYTTLEREVDYGYADNANDGQLDFEDVPGFEF